MKYKILFCSDAEGLESMVERFAADGWELHGSLSVYATGEDRDGNPILQFAQPMVIKASKSTEEIAAAALYKQCLTKS